MREKNKSKTEKEKSRRAATMKEVSVEVLSGGKPIKHFIVETPGRERIHANGRSIVSIGEFPPLPSIHISVSPEDEYRIQFDKQTRDYFVRPRNNTVTFRVHGRVVRVAAAPPRPRTRQTGIDADARQRQIQEHYAREQAQRNFSYTNHRVLRNKLVEIYPLIPYPKYIICPMTRAEEDEHVAIVHLGSGIVSYMAYTTMFEDRGRYMEMPNCNLDAFCRYQCAPNGLVRIIEIPEYNMPPRYRRIVEGRRRLGWE